VGDVGFNLLTAGSYIDNKARLNVEMGYFTVLHVSLGAKFGNLRAKDSNAFYKQLIIKENQEGTFSTPKLYHYVLLFYKSDASQKICSMT